MWNHKWLVKPAHTHRVAHRLWKMRCHIPIENAITISNAFGLTYRYFSVWSFNFYWSISLWWLELRYFKQKAEWTENQHLFLFLNKYSEGKYIWIETFGWEWRFVCITKVLMSFYVRIFKKSTVIRLIDALTLQNDQRNIEYYKFQHFIFRT